MSENKKKSSFLKDFKSFVTRGNVIDMAVGVVIGASFGKIITGLVNYIINPFVGIFMKKGNLDSLRTVITPAVLDDVGTVTSPEVAILWGTWLQTIVDFLITALCIFTVIRIIMLAKNKLEAEKLAQNEAAKREADEKAAADKKAADEAAAKLAEKQEALNASSLNQEKLLGEIRDMLKNK